MKLVDWVTAGAPSANGTIKFADNPQRNKYYVANQGCDQVTVFDLGTRLAMRVVDVGQIPGFTESPHIIKISPDGRFWYIVFLASNPYIEIYNAEDDTYEGAINIGFGDWNTLTISDDGRYAFAVSYSSQKIQVADLVNRVALPQAIQPGQQLHGQAIHPDFTSLYVTQQDLSSLFKLSFTDPMNPDQLDEICLTPNCLPNPGGELQPHEIAFTPDGTKYLVTCQGTDEVRIFQTSNDSLLAIIPTGDDPSEIAFDAQTQQAFITCMDDITTFASDPGKVGSVAVINYQTQTLVKHIYTGHQPHGLAVDAPTRTVYVANRNKSLGGPAPHHSTACGGRNGYITLIDINTLEIRSEYKAEVSTDPYSVAIRRTNN
jgi:DNA-binding beta-propeller fold protein YncE